MADTREPEDRPRPASPLLSSPTSPYVTSPPVSLRSSPACPRSSPDSSPHFSPDAPRLGSRPSRRLVSSPQISSGLVVVSSGLVWATNGRRTNDEPGGAHTVSAASRGPGFGFGFGHGLGSGSGARRCCSLLELDGAAFGHDGTRGSTLPACVSGVRTHARTHRNVT